MLAPVALFVYNRPEHTRKVLDALANNDLAAETILFIFSDGPKIGASNEDLKNIDQVRIIIGMEKRFKKVNIIESPGNKGLASSITSGVTQIVNTFEKIIVLEDDIVTDKYFLKFCNEALERYESHKQVMAISGFTFPASKRLPDTFFLSIFACWGWATWKNRWQFFNADSAGLLNEIRSKNRIADFNFNNSYDHYGLLQSQAEGKINTWAINWYASIFLRNGLTLNPSKSLTQNIGMDGTGTHYKGVAPKSKWGAEVVVSNSKSATKEFLFTDSISTSKKIDRKFEKYLRRMYSQSIISRAKSALKRIFQNI